MRSRPNPDFLPHLAWECSRSELTGYVSDLNLETGECMLVFDIDHPCKAVIEDPAFRQPGNPYVECDRVSLPISVVADIWEAWVHEEPVYGGAVILRCADDPFEWADDVDGSAFPDELHALAREVREQGRAHPGHRAVTWAETASDEEIWDVLQHGGLDRKLGLNAPQIAQLGKVAGDGTFAENLRGYLFARDAAGDLGMWYLANPAARKAGRQHVLWDIQADISEFADLSDRT